MFQHTSSEVSGYNSHKHLKNRKIKRVTGDKIKNNDKKLILPKAAEINKEIASRYQHFHEVRVSTHLSKEFL